MKTIETPRLRIRPFALEDAAFALELVNDPSWLRFIGDKGVRTLEDARGYIRKGPLDMYARLGFGLMVVELKETGAALGICGLIKRPGLDDVDIGFAFLPAYRAKGYARESAAAVLEHGHSDLGLKRIVAITSPDNADSVRLLERLGLAFVQRIRLTEDAEESLLFVRDFAAAP